MTLSEDTYQMMLTANRPMDYHEICDVMHMNKSTFGGVIFRLLTDGKIICVGEVRKPRTDRHASRKIKLFSAKLTEKPAGSIVVRLTDTRHWVRHTPIWYVVGSTGERYES